MKGDNRGTGMSKKIKIGRIEDEEILLRGLVKSVSKVKRLENMGKMVLSFRRSRS